MKARIVVTTQTKRVQEITRNEWIEVSCSRFSMGAQSSCPDAPGFDHQAKRRESPVHVVELDAFSITRYPVSVREYEVFVTVGGYEKREYWNAGGFGEWRQPEDWFPQLASPNAPVVGVSWYEAKAFSQWYGADLPTEAQWERVARGASGRRYPWGAEPPEPDRLNFASSGRQRPALRGEFPGDSTPSGVCGLAGDVLEWCRDSYGRYTNPVAPCSGQRKTMERLWKVLRGGCYADPAEVTRGTHRSADRPFVRSSMVGFRLVSGTENS